jgi:putative MATE family efflux protein
MKQLEYLMSQTGILTKAKKKFIGDKAFYRYLIFLAFPMIVQNGITSFVSFLDNIMVGQIGTEPMSGVAIVNQLFFVFNICIFGGVSGAGIFSAQFFGKGDYEGQKYTFRFKLYACLLITAIACVLFHFLDEPLISLYLNDGGSVGNTRLALSYGKEYLAIMIFGLLPFAVSQTYVSTIRETGQTFVPMVSGIVAVITNLVLDYVLIFGAFGAPELGVAGAAIATVIARYTECLIVVVWAHRHPDKNPYLIGVYKGLRIPGSILADIFRKGLPLMFNEMLWAVGMAVIVQCYAVRGLEVVAAQNISSTISNLFNIVYLQLGNCISIVVGQKLGAGQLEEAKDADNKIIFFDVACCACISVIMILLGGLFPEIYKTEPGIKALAKNFIIISAMAMPLCAFSHCSYFTLRSGGKTIVTFLFDSVYTWVVMIPYAFVLSRFTTLSITMVFFLVSFTEIIKVIIGFFMIKSNVWLQNIVNSY